MPKYPKITPPLLPSPQTVRWHKRDLQLPHVLPISIDENVLSELRFDLAAYKIEIEHHVGIELVICPGQECQSICLQIDFQAIRLKNDEAYRLKIGESGILIEVRAEIGLINALKTMKQIFFFSGRTLPYCYITDWPDRPKRGILLSLPTVTEKTEKELKEFLLIMSSVKLNHLQILVESYKESRFLPWAYLRLKKYGADLQIQVEFLKESSENSEIIYYQMEKESKILGFNLEAESLMVLLQDDTHNHVVFSFLENINRQAITVLEYYQLPYLGAALWSWARRLDSDVQLWLDDLVFNEMTGSAARLIADLREIFFFTEDKSLPSLDELFKHLNGNSRLKLSLSSDSQDVQALIDRIEIERDQLYYLEFQGKKGKIFLNQLILLLDLILLSWQYYALWVQGDSEKEALLLQDRFLELYKSYGFS